jgi:hypothetical protein
MTDTMTRPADEAAEEAAALAARKAKIADARRLLDLLDADDSIPLPFELGAGEILFSLYTYSGNAESEIVALARKLPAGNWKKSAEEYRFEMTALMKGGLKLAIMAPRSAVCERVVTTRTVMVPDPEALAAVPMVEAAEEVTTWRCPDSILAPAAGQTTAEVTA